MNKIHKLGLIIIRDRKFLINRKYGTKLFLLPGGKKELGESAWQCLEREIAEEHNCKLRKDTLEYIGEFEDIAANEPNTIIIINKRVSIAECGDYVKI